MMAGRALSASISTASLVESDAMSHSVGSKGVSMVTPGAACRPDGAWCASYSWKAP
jgi:hypothetical protein